MFQFGQFAHRDICDLTLLSTRSNSRLLKFPGFLFYVSAQPFISNLSPLDANMYIWKEEGEINS